MLSGLRNLIVSNPRYSAIREFLLPPGCQGARRTIKKLFNLYLARLEEMRGRIQLRSYPIKLTLEATNVCNLRCPACYTGVGDLGRPRSSMSLELYRKVLAELGDYLFEIEFCNWGEPLLSKYICTMIKEAAERGISTTIASNFSIPFDAEKAERLVSAGLTVLGVSIDGARQESYEKYRVKGNLETVLRNCRLVADAKKKLRSKTPQLVWSFHVFEHNVGDIELAKAMAKELEMDLSILKGWVEGAEWNPEGEWRFFGDPTVGRCPFLWKFAVVNNDGGVAPCCGTFFREDDMGKIAVSPEDLAVSTFKEVWNGPKFQAARGFYRSRVGSDETRKLICFDCPKTVIYENWKKHRAAGGTRDSFEVGCTTNDSFNFFWNRRRVHSETRKSTSSHVTRTQSSRNAAGS